MKTVLLSEIEKNLRATVQDVLENVEPTIVTTESGASVVIVSLDEFNAWQETLYLLSTPANADHLRRSVAEDEAGYASPKPLSEP